MLERYDIVIGAEAVNDIARELLRAAGETLERHGPDPNAVSIVAAGFVRAIQQMDEIDPAIGKLICKMLSK